MLRTVGRKLGFCGWVNWRGTYYMYSVLVCGRPGVCMRLGELEGNLLHVFRSSLWASGGLQRNSEKV